MRCFLLLFVFACSIVNAQKIDYTISYMKSTWQYELDNDPFESSPDNKALVAGDVINKGRKCCYFNTSQAGSNITYMKFRTNVHKDYGKYEEIAFINALMSKQTADYKAGTAYIKIDNNPVLKFGLTVYSGSDTIWITEGGYNEQLSELLRQMKSGNEMFVKLSREGGDYEGTEDVFMVLRFTLKGSSRAINGASGIKQSKPSNIKARENFIKQVNAINPFDLKAYYNSFIKDLKHFGIYRSHGTVDIQFGQLDGDALAVANSMYNDNRVRITVDPENWADASQAKRVYIMYHELAHDILNIEHTNSGLMAPTVGDVSYQKLAVDLATFFNSVKKLN